MIRLIQASVLLAFCLQSNISFSSVDHSKKFQELLEDVRFSLKKEGRSSIIKKQSELRFRNEDRLKSIHSLIKNKYSEDYRELLGIAIRSGSGEIVQYLIEERGVSIDLQQLKEIIHHDGIFEREGALWPIVQSNISMLLTKKNSDFVRKDMILFLSNLKFQIHPEFFDQISKAFELNVSELSLSLDKNKNTPLMLALCGNNSVAIDRFLEISDSESIEKINKFGWQAIHCAARFASTENILKIIERVSNRKLRAYSYTLNRKVRPSEMLKCNDLLSYEEKQELASLMDAT